LRSLLPRLLSLSRPGYPSWNDDVGEPRANSSSKVHRLPGYATRPICHDGPDALALFSFDLAFDLEQHRTATSTATAERAAPARDGAAYRLDALEPSQAIVTSYIS
jgi:hypothetical protein